MNLQGRRVIKFDVKREDLSNKQVISDVLNQAFLIHTKNKSEIDYLINYYKGLQPVLDKKKEIRSEINNKLVLNHAQMITRKIVGYFLGNPIQYISSGIGGQDKRELVDELNVYTQYENKPTIDKELGEYQSICGTAYRIIFKDDDFIDGLEDSVPFEDRSLNPSTTFIVYDSGISGKPIMGVTYYETKMIDGTIGYRFYVYTEFGRYEFLSSGYGDVFPSDMVEFIPYNVGGIPIIEYPNNMWRIGDWEMVIGLMNSINDLNSGRLDDIDQVIQSLLVFINADMDEEIYDEMREKGIVMLKNTTGAKSQVETIVSKLDQVGISKFAEELEELLYSLVGVPSRNDGSSSGGDTGLAIELRDGWADLETICKNKELVFRESEKKSLNIILNIFNIGKSETLNRLDLDIKFSRNKNNNMLVKTQSYQTLLASKTISPEDALSIVDLVSDPNDYIDRGMSFWEDDFGGKVEKEVGEIDENIEIVPEIEPN